MATNDSFEIPRLNISGQIPLAELNTRYNNPQAVANARARIEAITAPTTSPDPARSTRISDIELITDRSTLAKKLQHPSQRRLVPSAVQPLLTAIGTFALLLLAFKAPVILNQLHYATSTPPAVSTLPVAGSVIPSEPTINIPKINVHAPLVDIPTRNEADVQKGLQSGVIHYSGTPEPGQPGNSVFFGHSSNDWWEPGNYKFVFVLLDKLAIGDQFTIDYGSKRYTYEVVSSTVVEPNNVGVLAPTAEPTVTIITCTPPGTSWKRLVVAAKQIDPAPSASKVTTATPNGGAAELPNGTPGLATQVGNALSGVYHGVLSLFGADHRSAEPSTTTATDGTVLPGVK